MSFDLVMGPGKGKRREHLSVAINYKHARPSGARIAYFVPVISDQLIGQLGWPAPPRCALYLGSDTHEGIAILTHDDGPAARRATAAKNNFRVSFVCVPPLKKAKVGRVGVVHRIVDLTVGAWGIPTHASPLALAFPLPEGMVRVDGRKKPKRRGIWPEDMPRFKDEPGADRREGTYVARSGALDRMTMGGVAETAT